MRLKNMWGLHQNTAYCVTNVENIPFQSRTRKVNKQLSINFVCLILIILKYFTVKNVLNEMFIHQCTS